MAGLISALFGGRSRPPDPNPLPGIGGYRMPRGVVGEDGYPGSTSVTRTIPGLNPRLAKINANSNTGWESGLGTAVETTQHAYRGDVHGAAIANPRETGTVATPLGMLRQKLVENSPAEEFGGRAYRTRQGDQTTGGNPLSGAQSVGGHSTRHTETPDTVAYTGVMLAQGVPGSNNVRNQVAQRYKAAPASTQTYKSAARADQAPVNSTGQASDGNVHPDRVTTDVNVPSRFVFRGGGVLSYAFDRQMPYTGRGNGARGADLSGSRYYAEGQSDQFFDAGQGEYGRARQQGNGSKRPTTFQEPAPWTTNFYDTTQEVQSGGETQSPDMVYVSPVGGRASNNTGRS